MTLVSSVLYNQLPAGSPFLWLQPHPPSPSFFFSYSSSFITPSVFTISSPCAAQKHVLHITGNVSGVCESQFTHPLGPGLCPCVKRQSLLGGFCCEDNRRCNMNAMFHCFNSETFLRCIFRFKRFCCVCLCMSVFLSEMQKEFSSEVQQRVTDGDKCLYAQASILFQELWSIKCCR